MGPCRLEKRKEVEFCWPGGGSRDGEALTPVLGSHSPSVSWETQPGLERDADRVPEALLLEATAWRWEEE